MSITRFQRPNLLWFQVVPLQGLIGVLAVPNPKCPVFGEAVDNLFDLWSSDGVTSER